MADNVTTWRDLADQLMAEQVAYLELSERNPVPNPDGSIDEDANRRGQLFAARQMIVQNLAAVYHQHVPTPTGAVEVEPWEPVGDGYERIWCGRSWSVPIGSADGPARVEVSGDQRADGTVACGIVAYCLDDRMTAVEARQLAVALIEAADELDGISGRGGASEATR